MRILFSLTAMAVVLAGCARTAEPVAVAVAPPPVAPPAPMVRPVPPAGSAANITLPPRLADGSFDTPNRALKPAATTWHLRAALNVAALRCNSTALVANYNGFVRTLARMLAKAHDTATAEAGGQAAFDGRMTKLYNYFALPPVQDAFCSAATMIAAEAATVAPEDLEQLAMLGLPVLDAPFANFFARYAEYRAELARYEAAQGGAPQAMAAVAMPAGPAAPTAVAAAPAPRLAYDMTVMTADPAGRRIGTALAAR